MAARARGEERFDDRAPQSAGRAGDDDVKTVHSEPRAITGDYTTPARYGTGAKAAPAP